MQMNKKETDKFSKRIENSEKACLNLIFTWIILTQLLKTSKIALLLLKILNQTENKN